MVWWNTQQCIELTIVSEEKYENGLGPHLKHTIEQTEKRQAQYSELKAWTEMQGKT